MPLQLAICQSITAYARSQRINATWFDPLLDIGVRVGIELSFVAFAFEQQKAGNGI